MSIPKKFFTYWEGDQLSILHYYTIYSLRKYNPDTQITIYTSKNTGSKLSQWNSREHSIKIQNKVTLDSLINIDVSNISLTEIDFNKEYNVENDISVVYKADFIRIAKLYEHGGMWFDMDILFIKPIPDHLFHTDTELYFYMYLETIPTGLLFSSPKNTFITQLYEKALNIIVNIKSNQTHHYQVLGPNLWIKFLNEFKCPCVLHCLIKSDVYPYDSSNIIGIYSNLNCIEPNTFGLHWYNGDSYTKHFINRLNIQSLNPSNSIIEKMLFNVINNID
jgi:hypothetical protein